MKKYVCKLDVDEKIVYNGNSNTTLINGKIYKESKVTEMFPSLFEEVNELENIIIVAKDIIDDTIINNSIVIDTDYQNEEKTEKKPHSLYYKKEKNNFSWNRLLLLFCATFTIAGISAYLRVHGISIIFKIDIILALILVLGFIISEFAIASLLLREIKSKLHAVLNYIVLISIQLILIGMSFVFEFTTMSDWILVNKNKSTIVNKKESIVQDTLKDFDLKIKSIQDQIAITPDSYLTKRSKLTSELNIIIDNKNKEKIKIESMLLDTNTTDKMIETQGMESAASVLNVSDHDLTKGVLIVIAGILNVLYLFFIYGFITEWKRRS